MTRILHDSIVAGARARQVVARRSVSPCRASDWTKGKNILYADRQANSTIYTSVLPIFAARGAAPIPLKVHSLATHILINQNYAWLV